ncbi:MAG: hypothetical protein KJO98_17070 [Rhodothermia bacterium]|nr:hypothetical protein [Rhodothermia bacterium]
MTFAISRDMLRCAAAIMILAATTLPPGMRVADAQDAADILQRMADRQEQRWSAVQNYTITVEVQEAGGLQTPMYFEKVSVDGNDSFQMISPATYQRAMQIEAGFPPPEDVAEGLAKGYDAMGRTGLGGIPIVAGDESVSFGDMSDFLRFSAAASREAGDLSQYQESAKSDLRHAALFAERARLAGIESTPATQNYDGSGTEEREAYLLVADDLDGIELEQPEDGPEFYVDKVSVWIDTEQYVPLKMRVEGQIEKDGKRSPLVIEKLDLNYKQVGPLYESFRRVGRITGLMAGMSEKERKDLQKAQKELAKAKEEMKKMEGMSEAQKNMVMKMMAPQMEKLEKMAAGGMIESVQQVIHIAVNEGPPTPYGMGTLTVAASDVRALTMAGESGGSAELAIMRGGPPAESMISLFAGESWPAEGESISIVNASGDVAGGGDHLTIQGGSGSISVEGRTESRIYGTYAATLQTQAENGDTIPISISGEFDSGAPAGSRGGPRGSPFQFMKGMIGSAANAAETND